MDPARRADIRRYFRNWCSWISLQFTYEGHSWGPNLEIFTALVYGLLLKLSKIGDFWNSTFEFKYENSKKNILWWCQKNAMMHSLCSIAFALDVSIGARGTSMWLIKIFWEALIGKFDFKGLIYRSDRKHSTFRLHFSKMRQFWLFIQSRVPNDVTLK